MTESRASDIAVGASVPDPACLGVADPRTEAAPDGIDVYFDKVGGDQDPHAAGLSPPSTSGPSRRVLRESPRRPSAGSRTAPCSMTRPSAPTLPRRRCERNPASPAGRHTDAPRRGVTSPCPHAPGLTSPEKHPHCICELRKGTREGPTTQSPLPRGSSLGDSEGGRYASDSPLCVLCPGGALRVAKGCSHAASCWNRQGSGRPAMVSRAELQLPLLSRKASALRSTRSPRRPSPRKKTSAVRRWD